MKDILTEQEAKTRWCPLAKQGDAFGKESQWVAINRLSDGSPLSLCIGSECMAWRKAHSDDANGTERGFCGAFGLPRFV